MDYRVISIGTLAAHPLWGEGRNVDLRTGHATTTLVSSDGAHILVDPSLPAKAMIARLGERSPIKPHEITHVFLTAADFVHFRSMAVFPQAIWLAHETELAAVTTDLNTQLEASDDAELSELIEAKLDLVGRCRPAPDRIVQDVDLFPLPGVTQGLCGLVLSMPAATIVICGDAVATQEHLEQSKVLPDCYDVELARESFAEAVQIADLLIPGRDNLTLNAMRRPVGL